MVSAWATANRLALGQVKVDEKSNEITAIPELIKVFYLKGCIVTIDALCLPYARPYYLLKKRSGAQETLGCQKDIVKQIVAQDADYVITLKKNQGGLYKRVEDLFKQALKNRWQEYIYSDYRLSESGHGREETRFYQMLSNVQEDIDP